jgi:diadenosine tetraphosphate (Ap4A) HIT family hydrolase
MRVIQTTRANYAKDQKEKKGCFFCDEAIIKAQECTIFNYTHWYVLVNIHPYLNGNVMLLPKKHKVKLAALQPEEWSEFAQALVEVQKVLGDMFTTTSFNIGLNEGKHSGRSVSHLHWQIIPRHKKNLTVVGVLADIYVITMSSQELKKKLSK